MHEHGCRRCCCYSMRVEKTVTKRIVGNISHATENRQVPGAWKVASAPRLLTGKHEVISPARRGQYRRRSREVTECFTSVSPSLYVDLTTDGPRGRIYRAWWSGVSGIDKSQSLLWLASGTLLHCAWVKRLPVN